MKTVILAAGKSSEFIKKFKNKCLIEINGESLIQNTIKKLLKTKN